MLGKSVVAPFICLYSSNSSQLDSSDLSYADGDDPLWDEYMDQIERLATAVPYFVNIGNHEVFLLSFPLTSYLAKTNLSSLLLSRQNTENVQLLTMPGLQCLPMGSQMLKKPETFGIPLIGGQFTWSSALF